MPLKTTANALGFFVISDLSSAVKLPTPAYTGQGFATLAVIQVENQPVRWRDDGVAPTATVGMLLPVGAELSYDGDMGALQMIQTAASAKVSVSFYN